MALNYKLLVVVIVWTKGSSIDSKLSELTFISLAPFEMCICAGFLWTRPLHKSDERTRFWLLLGTTFMLLPRKESSDRMYFAVSCFYCCHLNLDLKVVHYSDHGIPWPALPGFSNTISYSMEKIPIYDLCPLFNYHTPGVRTRNNILPTFHR